VDALLDLAGPGVESRLTAVEIRHLGGALGRQSRPGNAVGGRNAPFSLFAAGGLGPGPAGIVADEGQRVLAGLAPWGTGGTQINLLGAPDQSRVQSSWPPDVYRRLQAVKRMYDPHNLFRHGHTVRAEASS
jgi:hypothetical protein